MELNDKAYTIHLDAETRRRGRFRKGNIPWNRGLSWDEQGVSLDEQKRRVERLRFMAHQKCERRGGATKQYPVIQMDDYGDRLHWYESSEAAARKIGCAGRNIRKVCDGQRKHAGGYRWKWDERFYKQTKC